MINKVLALTINGDLTYCTAPPDMRGKRRCNHIQHQKEGESLENFLSSVEDKIKVENDEIIDNYSITKKLLNEYGNQKNPNWDDVIRSIPNPFNIGKEDDGSYEEAELLNINQELISNNIGDRYYKITAEYIFRGRKFECNYGEMPFVNEDGTISLDGVNWRVLPVVDQNKAGVISYNDNIVIKQNDGRNISIILNKDPSIETCKIYGKDVSIDIVENYLKNGEIKGLTSGQVYALKNIDPIVFERFPNLKNNIRELKNLTVDEVGDLNWHRCFKYEDFVKEQIRLQSRRMGVTFRTNLSKRQSTDVENPLNEEYDLKYPLFYQVNLTENIKKDLVSRSNVQHADNLNPISALSQSQKISFTGPGGYHKDKAPYNLRMPHKSHEHVIDSMDVSSGKNVGLTATLSTGYIDDRGFIRKKQKDSKQLSPSDFIPYKYHNDPNRGIMAVAHLKQACPIIGGEDPLPLSDSTSDKAWEKIKGSKLGCELLTTYIPQDGVFEDSVIISESVASKMTTIQSNNYKLNRKKHELQIGQRVERKQEIGGSEIKTGGLITKINDYSFTVETSYKMTPGDKLAGRHGNKSVVSKVIPDKEMPLVFNEKTEKLEPAQVIMSPTSVVGRKNLGQIMECNNSMGDGPTVNKKRKIVLPGGHQIEATAGKQYIMRLNHIAEKKLSSHADEITAKRESSGSRLGEMESILLSTDEDRLKVLDYLRHQEAYDSHKKLNSLLKAIGVDMSGVNWNKQQ